jgi:hypothetical protein
MYCVMYKNLKVGSYTYKRMQFQYEGCGLVVTACNVVDGTSVEEERAVSFVRVEVK